MRDGQPSPGAVVADERTAASDGAQTQSKRPVVRAEAAKWSPLEKLQYLRERNVGDCRRCGLCASRRNIVFGVGDASADLMFVGEAPGAEEDRQGEPFVGAAGKRLDRWIDGLGLRREQVYIANVLKCRPPGNRDPSREEVVTCSPFLRAQIRVVQPRVIVTLGRFAACLLLGREARMHEMRGRVHEYVQPDVDLRVPLVATYHPSYVLRTEGDARRRTDNSNERKSADETVLSDLARAAQLLEQ